jgi:hypothetical protein
MKFRTRELADFVEAASSVCGFDLQYVVALGYSNGAMVEVIVSELNGSSRACQHEFDIALNSFWLRLSLDSIPVV